MRTTALDPRLQYTINLIIPRFKPAEQTLEEGGELDGVLKTFLSVHSAYNSSLGPAVDALHNYPCKHQGNVFKVEFAEKVPQPLGWLISEKARKSLEDQLKDSSELKKILQPES